MHLLSIIVQSYRPGNSYDVCVSMNHSVMTFLLCFCVTCKQHRFKSESRINMSLCLYRSYYE